jgi:hypothetical protein
MLDEQELYERALDAYVYAFPLVLMDFTKTMSTISRTPGTWRVNRFDHRRRYPDASFKTVVRPNADTLYSSLWYEVHQRPLLVTVPDTGGRYYVVPLMDMWTDVFASIGSRTTGTAAGKYLIVSRNWTGTAPEGVRVIESPTDAGWIIGRIQTNGVADYPTVHALQDGITAEPFGPEPESPTYLMVSPDVDLKVSPVRQTLGLGVAEFFERFNALLHLYPPHIADQAQVMRMEALGLGPELDFRYADLDPVVQGVLDRATKDAQRMIIEPDPRRSRIDDGWAVEPGTGNYGINYAERSLVAFAALAALPPQEAMYPRVSVDGEGEALSGKNRYILHFDGDSLPPVGAFWSLTMYGPDQAFVDNPINRYAIGDRDELVFGADGSLSLYIQHENPGAEREANWLPAPADGGFSMNMRLYLPSRAAIDGDWTTPPVSRVS